MNFLFVKDRFTWPFSSGHDVHTAGMANALAARGCRIGILTSDRSDPRALARLDADRVAFFDETPDDDSLPPASGLQERFRRYWGISRRKQRQVADFAHDFGADVVVMSGLTVLPYLAEVRGAKRIWYAADELALHHLSLVPGGRLKDAAANLREAALKAVYERTFADKLDAVWVVTDADRLAMKLVTGVPRVEVLPNGTDAVRYRPADADELPDSCVFWGRLDFGPNIQGLRWFADAVWPRLETLKRPVRFTVIGFSPTSEVRALCTRHGWQLLADLPDLRGEVARHQSVVLPFVSGLGMKNKFLEAAAMAKPVVCTPRALLGCSSSGRRAVLCAKRPELWAEHLSRLWDDAALRRELGRAARNWVISEHAWDRTASKALASLAAA